MSGNGRLRQMQLLRRGRDFSTLRNGEERSEKPEVKIVGVHMSLSTDLASGQRQLRSRSSHLGGKSQRMSSQELRCPFGIATFERLEDRFMELSHLHHIEFLRSKEDSIRNTHIQDQKKIVVFGATGTIGKAVVAALSPKYEVLQVVMSIVPGEF